MAVLLRKPDSNRPKVYEKREFVWLLADTYELIGLGKASVTKPGPGPFERFVDYWSREIVGIPVLMSGGTIGSVLKKRDEAYQKVGNS